MAAKSNNSSATGCPGFPDWSRLGKRFVFAPDLPSGRRAAFREVEYLLQSARPIKVSGSTTAGVATLDGTPYFVKRSNVPTWLDRVRRLGRLSRAKRNFIVSKRLAELGVRVPKVWVAVSTSRYGLPGPSYLVTEFLEPPMTVHDSLGAMLESRDLEHWVRKMTATMALLHDCGIRHGDLKMVNFLAVPDPEESDGFTVGLLDFDGTAMSRLSCSRRVRRKELARAISSCQLLCEKLEPGHTREALGEMIQLWSEAYCDAGGTDFQGDPALEEEVLRFLERAAQREKRTL